jgi:hypothetical protein
MSDEGHSAGTVWDGARPRVMVELHGLHSIIVCVWHAYLKSAMHGASCVLGDPGRRVWKSKSIGDGRCAVFRGESLCLSRDASLELMSSKAWRNAPPQSLLSMPSPSAVSTYHTHP